MKARGIPPTLLDEHRVLIHNVSHSDLLVALRCQPEEWKLAGETRPAPGETHALLGRPQYAKFSPIRYEGPMATRVSTQKCGRTCVIKWENALFFAYFL